MRVLRSLVLVTPGPLVLAVVGLFHPRTLTPQTAHMWATMHVPLLPVFPLLALGLVVPLWGRPGRDVAGVATVIAWLGAFLFAAGYTGLDAVAGIAAGTVMDQRAGQDVGALVQQLFHAGDQLGQAGVRCLAIGLAAATVALVLRRGPWVLPGAAITAVATWSFFDSHIFYPRGVLTMLGFAVGFALMSVPPPRDRPGSGGY
jgi:hypothetical protein